MHSRDYLKKPDWLKVKIPSGEEYKSIYKVLEQHNLSTVCQEARCPNIAECWNKKSATVMILGKVCTRACRFCAVATGNPKGALDAREPQHVAEVVKTLGLKYVVITSVDRDDLEDLGSTHYSETIGHIKRLSKDTRVEALIPDFNADMICLKRIISAKPYVIGHNIETVKRLTPHIRDRRCGYERSLNVLKECKKLAKDVLTKSGFMVGLGEEKDELTETLKDLKVAGVDVVTVGQYLQPTKKHMPVQRYYSPAEFDMLKELGEDLGIRYMITGPLVRSSYHAAEAVS